MDFSFSEEQEAVTDLAAQIFEGMADVDRVRTVERSVEPFDRELWAQLAEAGLLGIGLPEAHGGAGLGLIEALLVLEQQGRRVAPVPYWSTIVVGALALAELGSEAQQARVAGIVAGDTIVSAALDQEGSADPGRPASKATPTDEGWQLDGVAPAAPYAPLADLILTSATTGDGTGVFLVDPSATGVEIESVVPTSHTSAGRVTLTSAPAERVGGPEALEWVLARGRLGLAALQLGITEEAVRMTAEYVSEREQFGRPLSTNQGVALQAADAYILTQAIRTTLWQAAWYLTEGRDAEAEVLVASWWTAEAGHKILHTTQHLHGGMGADIDYPVHRYFIWGKQVGTTLGVPGSTAASLGDLLAGRAVATAPDEGEDAA